MSASPNTANETPHYLRDLHRTPLATIDRLGEPCEPCRGTGFPLQQYDCIDEDGWNMVLCKPCRGTGKQGGALLHVLPNPALVVLVCALAREVWTGDDPHATAQDRERGGYVPGTILQRRANGRVYTHASGYMYAAGMPVSFASHRALVWAAIDSRSESVRRLCNHALACRSLLSTLLAEASRRRILPTQADLLVAWDHALAHGVLKTDDDCRLLLAEAWAACFVAPEQRETAEADATAWLWRLRVAASPVADFAEQLDAIGAQFNLSRAPGESYPAFRERLRACVHHVTGRSSRAGVQTYDVDYAADPTYREPAEIFSRDSFADAMRNARLYGGAVLALDVGDGSDEP